MKTTDELLWELEAAKKRKSEAEEEIFELEEQIEDLDFWAEVRESIESTLRTVPFRISHYRTRAGVASPVVTLVGYAPTRIVASYDEKEDNVTVQCAGDQVSFSGPLPNIQAFLARKGMTVDWSPLIEGLRLERTEHVKAIQHIDATIGSL